MLQAAYLKKNWSTSDSKHPRVSHEVREAQQRQSRERCINVRLIPGTECVIGIRIRDERLVCWNVGSRDNKGYLWEDRFVALSSSRAYDFSISKDGKRLLIAKGEQHGIEL